MNYQLETFLSQPSDRKKVIVVYGPTASWKTSHAIELAKQLQTEIISTDSRQIYKHMNIGTWKVTYDEMQWVKHHMLDIIEPSEHYSVGQFIEDSEMHLTNMFHAWKIPILAGWTWLYIDGLIYEKNAELPWDLELQKKLTQELSEKWSVFMHKKLKEIDPKYAQELHPNNSYYILRGLEVMMLTGKSKTYFRSNRKLKYDVFFAQTWANYTRKTLYERINKRVEQMFEEWLEQEVRLLLEKWYKFWEPWMKSIGYSEFEAYFAWNYDREKCRKLIQQHSRNYAKRQLTWGRKYNSLTQL